MKNKIKRIFSVFLAVTLIMTLLPQSVFAEDSSGTAQISEENAITRGEWLEKLVSAFSMYVDSDNAPDNYFSDLDSDNQYYWTVMRAVEYGVLDIEAGGEVRVEDPATRDFAATTLNKCLGFVKDDETYSFGDSADCSNPLDAQIAIDRGWFELIDGNFKPQNYVSYDEAEKMIQDAENVINSTKIGDESYSEYVFADYVKEIPENVAVDIDENDVVTIHNTDVTLEKGDTFVVYPSDFPSIYVAETVTKTDNDIIVETSEVSDENAVISAEAKGTTQIDLSQFKEADDAEVMYIRTESDVSRARQLYGITPGINSVVVNESVPLGAGISATVICNLSNLKLEKDINTGKSEYYLAVTGDMQITSTVSCDALSAGGYEKSVVFGTVNILGVGNITLSAELTLSGTTTIVYKGSFKTGFKSSKNEKRIIANLVEKDFTCQVEVNAYIGIKVSASINFLVVKAEIYAKSGLQGKYISNGYSDGKKPLTCTTIAGCLSASVGANASVLGKSIFRQDMTLYGFSNSPIRISMHYEDGIYVSSCKRGEDINNPRYFSPINSRFIGSAYGTGNDYGYDDYGNPVVLFEYELDDAGNAIITGYNGRASAVTIPDTIDGYTVTGIAESAFKFNDRLALIILPDTLKTIADEAFAYCTKLVYMTIPDSVESIGERAFLGCENLVTVHLPNNKKYTEVAKSVFSDCKLLTSIEVPDTVETIGAGAFSDCTSLTSVKLPNNNKFTVLEENIFYDCTSLKGIDIPDTVTEINPGAFSMCAALERIELPDSITRLNRWLLTLGVFEGCVSLEEVKMPKRLEYIGGGTFSGCESLEEIFIPKTVTETGGGIFANCPSLKTITIEEGMTTIPADIFSDCTSIEEIEIPDTVTTIRTGVFSGCTGLKKIELPNSVTRLEGGLLCAGVFQGCTSLKEVKLPNRLEYIGSDAFNGCESLEEILIPKTVTEAGYRIFANCPKLKAITIESGMKVIPDYLFSDCTSIANIVIPDSVTKIGGNSFAGCTSLASIVIPDSVTKIDGSAFADCESLSNVTFSKNLTEIGTAAFKNCGFETIEFPESLTKIGTSAFVECSKLTEVTVPETIEDIPEYMFSACTKLAKVNLPDNIKKISTGMFMGCTSLTGITIPESVEEIGGSAFYGCESLTEINIPNSVKSIGAGVLANCENLSTVKLSNSLAKINEETFSGCPSLEKIVLLPGVTEIADKAFQHCAKLKEVYIPQTVETISDKAFSYYDKITIYGMKDSYAEQWADDNDVKFEEYEKSVTGLQLSETELRIQRGEEYKLNVTVVPEDYTDIVTWSSSNEDIVKVTSDGTLRTSYWNTGTATITVTAGTKSATCVVTVYDPDAVEDNNNSDNNVNDDNNGDNNGDDIGKDDNSGDDIGNGDDTEDNTKNIEVTEDSIYQITENADLEESNGTSLTITGVQTNTTVEECIKNFGDSDEISIVDKNGNEVEADAKVGTGFEVQKKADGIVIQVAVIIIKGDTDGTGTIDVLDMEAIQKSILGISKLIGAYKSAAIISGGETDISVLDMEAVQKDILGIAKIK